MPCMTQPVTTQNTCFLIIIVKGIALSQSVKSVLNFDWVGCIQKTGGQNPSLIIMGKQLFRSLIREQIACEGPENYPLK